jgi:hypothetical protein
LELARLEAQRKEERKRRLAEIEAKRTILSSEPDVAENDKSKL